MSGAQRESEQCTPMETALEANSLDLLHYFERRIDRDEAADLFAETMLVVWQREQDLPDSAEAARMWLFGVARNVLKNAERGRRRRHRLASKLKTMLRPQEASQAADDGVEVRDAVRRLAPELGELVRLVYWDGFSVADAGQLLGFSASTARRRYHQAKDQLRAALGEDAHRNSEYRPATLPKVNGDILPD